MDSRQDASVEDFGIDSPMDSGSDLMLMMMPASGDDSGSDSGVALEQCTKVDASMADSGVDSGMDPRKFKK